MGAEFYLGIAKGVLQFLGLLFTLWPFWVVVGLALLERVGPGLYDRWRLARAGMPEVDQMSGLDFEKFLQYLFERQGYAVERTRYIGDYGADLVLRNGGTRTLVQAKRYKGTVGVKAVQEAAAARPHYGCDKAIVVTNSRFTRQARELARSNRIELWDRSKLASVVLAYDARPGRRAASLSAGEESAASTVAATSTTAVQTTDAAPLRTAGPTPACPRCGSPMMLRRSKRGQFWGCSRFPSCRGLVPIDR